MMRPPTIVVAAVCLSACLGVLAGEATGPPKPVPYNRIADPPDDAQRHITVKTEDRGPVWLLTGFLHGWQAGLTYEHFARVKTKHVRTSDWLLWWQARDDHWSGSPVEAGKYLDAVLRLREQGMTHQHLLGFMCSSGRRVTNDQLDAFGDKVYTLVKYARHMGLPVDHWEVWNEPTPGPYEGVTSGFWRGTWEEFLGMWDAAYDAIRKADPEAKIVGPSYGMSHAEEMGPFLAHCKEKGQKLDVLSWHINCIRKGPNGEYWEEADYVWKNIDQMRELVETEYPMLGVEQYHIDEWGYYLPQTGMGAHIAYFYYMDLAGLDRAAKTGPPYMMSATRISPDTPRAAYWAWVDYAKQEGGVRLVTETNDRNLVAIASCHDEEKVVRAVVGRAKRQSMANPAGDAPAWKWGDHAPAKPPVSAKIDFEGLPLSGKAEVTILRLPHGTGPLYEDELAELTTTSMMDVEGGRLTIELADVVEDNAFSIVIGPKGTREKDKAQDAQWAKAKSEEDDEKGERELHKEATAKAKEAAKAGTVRIACGSAFAYTDPAGNGWFADREYAEGGFGHVGGGSAQRGPIEIGGTDNPEIYRTELWGQKSYHITLAKGKFLLRLHWAETYGLGPGGRTFDVVIEGKTVLKDFDAAREAGGVKKAVVKEIEVEVSDGVLDLEFPHKEGVTPLMNGIEVTRK